MEGNEQRRGRGGGGGGHQRHAKLTTIPVHQVKSSTSSRSPVHLENRNIRCQSVFADMTIHIIFWNYICYIRTSNTVLTMVVLR